MPRNDRSPAATTFAKNYVLAQSGTGNGIDGNPKPFVHSGLQTAYAGADAAKYFGADRLRQHWANRAAAVGLSTAQIKVLLLLAPGEAVPMRSLAARLDYDASNLSTLVDRLERRGAVERRGDPRDKRIKALALTSEDRLLRERFWRGLVDDPGPLTELGDADLTTLAAVLDTLQPDGQAAVRDARVPS